MKLPYESPIWHPLTQHQTATPPLAIEKSEGVYLIDEKGKKYIDAISSWYTCVYGHNHPQLVAAIKEQASQLDFAMLSGFTHPSAKTLANRLLEILPKKIQKVFFNDNGSTAIEAAIKMALQYHFNRNQKRDTLIAFENGFHGDTFGAMSASGLTVYKGPFNEFTLKVLRLPTPQEHNIDTVLELLEQYINEHHCAVFVYEPLVQGAAGMQFHDAQGLEKILQICQQHQVLCIADEIMTGFGKTGKNFASNYIETTPDIICLSKALTGGMFPLSVTACAQEIYDAFLDTSVSKAFMHAHTYSGHPLGCAVAIAGIELLASKEMQANIGRISESHKEFIKSIESNPKVLNPRSLGVILAFELAIEMERYGNLRNKLYHYFLDHAIILRPLGNTLYIIPPFVISNTELKKVYKSLASCLEEY